MLRFLSSGARGPLLALVASVAQLGCGGDERERSTPPGDKTHQDTPSGFVSDGTDAVGPRLWLEAHLESPPGLDIELWGAELGAVFGYSRFDSTTYRVATLTVPLIISDLWNEVP